MKFTSLATSPLGSPLVYRYRPREMG